MFPHNQKPPVIANQISDDDYSTEFFRGFHPDDQEVLASCLFAMKPQHPAHQPYNFNNVSTAMCGYFSNAQFYRPLQCCLHDEPSNPVHPRLTNPN
jgi:hypothetical protein